MKKLQQESSDTEDFLFTHKIEYSRYSNDFEELEEIGGGSFGRVYKCKHILDKLPYAVKKIPIKNNSEIAKEKAMQETYALATGASIDNLYIIKYHNA